MDLTPILAAVGAALIVAGVALVSIPAAFIVAGLVVMALSYSGLKVER